MNNLGEETGTARAGRVRRRPSKTERRAARQAVGACHEEQLGKLLAHVRDGLA
jgi:hypothetical protein